MADMCFSNKSLSLECFQPVLVGGNQDEIGHTIPLYSYNQSNVYVQYLPTFSFSFSLNVLVVFSMCFLRFR